MLISVNSDLDIAASIIELLIKETSNDCEIINLNGFLLFQQKKYKEALNIFLNNADKQNCKAKTLEYIGDTQFMLENPKKAIESWNNSKKIGNQNKLLERKINDRKFIPIVP